jgi:hypothetical protein
MAVQSSSIAKQQQEQQAYRETVQTLTWNRAQNQIYCTWTVRNFITRGHEQEVYSFL